MFRLSLVLVAGCGFVPRTATTDSPDAVELDANPALDSAIPLGPWGVPTPVVLSMTGVDDPTLTADLLELYFNANGDIYVAKRAMATDPWGPASLIALLSNANETTPEVSYDGLTLWFASDRTGAGTSGDEDIWVSTRLSRSAAWGIPTVITSVDSPTQEAGSVVTPDELTMVLSSYRKSNTSPDLYTSERTATTQAWPTPSEIVAVNTDSHEGSAFITVDKLWLYFDTDRAGGPLDIYVSHRSSVSEPFPTPQAIPEIDTAMDEEDPWVSPDQRHLFFYSDRGGMPGLWEASR